MTKNNIIKSLINGVLSWLVVALVISLKKDMPFVQTLVTPYSIICGGTAILGSYIGFMLRGFRQSRS